jgi:Na+/pantothenate symporter
MKKRLTLAWFCNLIDTFATLYLCGNGYATEINPFMRILLVNPIVFAIVKISLITLVLFWLWRERASKYAVIASYIACFIYGALALYYAVIFILFH